MFQQICYILFVSMLFLKRAVKSLVWIIKWSLFCNTIRKIFSTNYNGELLFRGWHSNFLIRLKHRDSRWPSGITLFIIIFLNLPLCEFKNQLIFYKVKGFKLSSSNAISFIIFKVSSRSCKYSSTYSTNMGSKVKKIMK